MTATTQPPWPAETRYLQTGDLLVDLCYRRVSCAGTEVELPQRIFDLLLLFLAEPETLHSRTGLFERLWPGVIVEDANLSQSIWLLRKALGEERKHWIGTVAKGGYVFTPPGPIEWLGSAPRDVQGPPPPADASTGPAAGVPDREVTGSTALAPAGHPQPRSIDLPAPAGPRSVQPAPRPWMRTGHGLAWAMAAVATIIVVVALTWPWLLGKAPGDAARMAPVQPLTIALMEVHDPAITTRWPVTLLREWLEWKLGSLPEVILLSESDLAASHGSNTAQIVFLAADTAPDDSGKVTLHARFEQDGRVQRLEVAGPASQVPTLVDTLSRQLVSKLVPARTGPWPALTLDAEAARHYAEAMEALDRRDWMAAAAMLTEVVEMAPRFGLARWHLAHAQGRLAQAASAVEQMDVASDLLQPAPPEVVELLEAQRLAVDPQNAMAAAQAYAGLARRYSHKSDYVLQHARLRLVAGQPETALKSLAAVEWDAKPTEARLAHLLLLGDLHLVMSEPKQALESAQRAERMARAAGDGWELERASALIQIAMATRAQEPQRTDTALYEQAAKLLEAAGNQTGALYVHFLIDASAPPAEGPDPKLDALLAKARAGGYRRLEMEILLRVAEQHHRVGDLPGYRNYLQQALASAAASGDAMRRNQLELLLLTEDFLQARFDSAGERVQRLRSAGLQGFSALLLDQLDASLQAVRGDNGHALQILDRAEPRLLELEADTTVSALQSRLACTRADVRLPLGDLAGARVDLKNCTATVKPFQQLIAMSAHARIELLAGDRTKAIRLLRRAHDLLVQLPDSPDRWLSALDLASLLTHAGHTAESAQLYSEVMPKLRTTGYTLLVAIAETGMAENAAANGDWTRSRQHAAQAAHGLPPDTWLLASRLSLLHAADAWAAGERPRAAAIVERLHARASELGDVITQMEIHGLLPNAAMPDGCTQAHRDAMVARSGMRGADMGWLASAFAKGDAAHVGNIK